MANTVATQAPPGAAAQRRPGFVGLGVQGSQIARQYLARGGALTVYDLRPEAVAALAADGATAAPSLAAVARECDLIGVCVVDDLQLEAVFLGDDGLIENASAGAIVAIHATVSPALVLRLADLAFERGVAIVDAPVSGGAVAGRPMSYMVGGAAAAVAECLPLIGEVGQTVTLTGGVGSGATAKLAHQIILCGNLLAAAEGMAFAEAFGVAPDIVREVVRLGAAQSGVGERWSGPALPADTARLLAKDLDVCAGMAAPHGLSLPGAALSRAHVSANSIGNI